MRSTLIFFFITSLLVGLGGCLTTGGEDTSDKTGTTQKVEVIPGLTPSQRNTEALNLLDKGKVEKARAELMASLAELPAEQNPKAKDYLGQIDGDPVKLLGSKNFDYEVKKGETLASIAKEHLGDPFKFYALARYNGMDNPSLLKVGQTIKVPGAGPPPQIAKETDGGGGGTQTAEGGAQTTEGGAQTAEGGAQTTEDGAQTAEGGAQTTEDGAQTAEGGAQTTEGGTQTAEGGAQTTEGSRQKSPDGDDGVTEKIATLLATAGGMADAGNYRDAIKLLEKGLEEFPDENLIKVYLGDNLVKLGGALTEQHKYKEALVAVQRAAALNLENDDIAERVARAKLATQADGLYQDGQKYEATRAYIEARQSYQAALKVWPDHESAQLALEKVNPKVADGYYREARTAFQQQDLDKALEYYNKTLEIDATHEPAKLERQRTIQLIDKLKQAG